MDGTKRDLSCVDAAEKRAVYDETEIKIINFEAFDVVTGSPDEGDWDISRHIRGRENE